MGIYTYIFTPELQAQDYMSGFVEPRSNECCHSQPASQPASRRPFSPLSLISTLMPVHLCQGKSIIGAKPATIAIVFEPASCCSFSLFILLSDIGFTRRHRNTMLDSQ